MRLLYGPSEEIRTPSFCAPNAAVYQLTYTWMWSGRRGTISQQSDWKSETLPIELLPHILGRVGAAPSLYRRRPTFPYNQSYVCIPTLFPTHIVWKLLLSQGLPT